MKFVSHISSEYFLLLAHFLFPPKTSMTYYISYYGITGIWYFVLFYFQSIFFVLFKLGTFCVLSSCSLIFVLSLLHSTVAFIRFYLSYLYVSILKFLLGSYVYLLFICWDFLFFSQFLNMLLFTHWDISMIILNNSVNKLL